MVPKHKSNAVKRAAGHKNWKDRLTVLLGGIAVGHIGKNSIHRAQYCMQFQHALGGSWNISHADKGEYHIDKLHLHW
jgi:hypothetical protein